MKRILILGCCGAGKSTFSKKLSKKIDVPVIHLDQHYWKPDWVESSKEEWEQKVQELASREEWIIDGNYSGTLDIRLNRADTIIYLDVSTLTCMSRVLRRIRKYKGKTRPDMPTGCNERYDWDFLHYVLVFNLTRRKKLLHKLRAHQHEKTIYIFKNKHEVNLFLKST